MSGGSSQVVLQGGGGQCHERSEGSAFQAPMFVKPLECLHCEIGQTMTFEGKVVGSPEPTIVWTKVRIVETDGQDRPTDRQTDKQTDKQTDIERPTYRQTDRRTDRQT